MKQFPPRIISPKSISWTSPLLDTNPGRCSRWEYERAAAAVRSHHQSDGNDGLCVRSMVRSRIVIFFYRILMGRGNLLITPQKLYFCGHMGCQIRIEIGCPPPPSHPFRACNNTQLTIISSPCVALVVLKIDFLVVSRQISPITTCPLDPYVLNGSVVWPSYIVGKSRHQDDLSPADWGGFWWWKV